MSRGRDGLGPKCSVTVYLAEILYGVLVGPHC